MKPKSENPMITNPLDELFNTAQDDHEISEYEHVTEGELAEMQAPPEKEEKDDEDIAIDAKIDAVYDAALETFQQQTEYTQIIEPRYAARNAEVAATYLSIALNAAATRAKVKGERKRQAAFVPYANKNSSSVVVASREEIMRMISVDAEVKEVK
ncbi:hypothetical protein [Acinetobacter sp.]|uniref:hypothetical protein n=1 Tax=Acinetobacter sp. TaxID=472 RepID=UPI0038908785